MLQKNQKHDLAKMTIMIDFDKKNRYLQLRF